MTVTIERKGLVELMSTWDGPKRKVRIVSFTGLAAPGGVLGAHFDTELQPIAVIDVTDGSLRTSEFSDTGNTRGELTQNDTGPSGHTCWAIYTDTGV